MVKRKYIAMVMRWEALSILVTLTGGVLYFYVDMLVGMIFAAYALVFSCVIAVIFSKKANPSLRIASIIFASLVLLAIVYDVCDAYFPKSTENISKYYRIKNRWWDNKELIKHFPEKLPKNSESAALYYTPAFLMGGASFQLKLKLSEDEIANCLSYFIPRGKDIFNGGKGFDHTNKTYSGLEPPISSYLTGDVDDGRFPEEFKVIVLDAKSYKPGTWNHGFSYGVAISEKRNIIVYWADDW